MNPLAMNVPFTRADRKRAMSNRFVEMPRRIWKGLRKRFAKQRAARKNNWTRALLRGFAAKRLAALRGGLENNS